MRGCLFHCGPVMVTGINVARDFGVGAHAMDTGSAYGFGKGGKNRCVECLEHNRPQTLYA